MGKMKIVWEGVEGNNKQARSQQNLTAFVEFSNEETAEDVAEQARKLIDANPPETASKFQGSIVMQDGTKVAVVTRCYDTARASATKRSWGFMGQAIALAAGTNAPEVVIEDQLPTREQAIESASKQA